MLKSFLQRYDFFSKSNFFCIFAVEKTLRSVAVIFFAEESPGNTEPPYHLTGGRCIATTTSATENNRLERNAPLELTDTELVEV